MRKTHLFLILIILLMICLLCSCSKKTKDNKTKTTEVETGGVPIDPNRHTDFSEIRDDLSKLAEDEITEIFLYWGNKEYGTTDKEIIRQIKEQLMTVELEEANFDDVFSSIETMWIGSGYVFYLCSGDKIYYKIRIIGPAVFCGHGQYKPISGEDGLYEVINIAKRTFWRD